MKKKICIIQIIVICLLFSSVNVFAQDSYFVGDISGNVSGDVSGNVSGDVSGNVSGDISGNIEATLHIDQPLVVTGEVGKSLTLKVVASGTGLTYQWQYSKDNGSTWINFSKATDSIMTKVLQKSWNGWLVRCEVTDGNGNKTASNSVKLKVITPLLITEQPSDVTGEAGSSATFTVSATGDGLTYQWQYSKDNGITWTNFSKATDSTMTKALQKSWNGWLVQCEVTDERGNKVTSNFAKINIKPLLITKQPLDVTGDVGTSASFTVEADGTGLKYQWQYSKDNGKTWANFSNATDATMTKALQLSWNGWLVHCVVSNQGGSIVTSNPAKINVTPFSITTQPVDVTGDVGTSATFKVEASLTGLTYQWQYSKDNGSTWTNFSNATGSTMTKALQKSWNGWLVRCEVGDSKGNKVISSTARITITGLLSIMTQPTSVSGDVGSSVEFKISAIGTGLTYQWQYSKDSGVTWTNFSNATKATMTKVLQKSWDGWNVRCVVTDSSGKKLNSSKAKITLTGPLTIMTQPTSVSGKIDSSVEFKISAIGTGLTYQWQYSKDGGSTWTNFSNATSATMTKVLQKSWNGWYVRCEVGDSKGNKLISNKAKITLEESLAIKTQPTSVCGEVGSNIEFNIDAVGTGLTYQWQYSKDGGTTWTNFSNATKSTMTKVLQKSWNGWLVHCVVFNDSGNIVTSNSAKITLAESLAIKTQPTSVSGEVGSSVEFNISAVGTGLTYQWQYSKDGGTTWTNFSNATKSTMTKVLQKSWNGWLVRCEVADSKGNTVISQIVAITINPNRIDYVEEHTHAWKEVSRVEATCDAPGSVTYHCDECGEDKTEELAKLTEGCSVVEPEPQPEPQPEPDDSTDQTELIQ